MLRRPDILLAAEKVIYLSESYLLLTRCFGRKLWFPITVLYAYIEHDRDL